MTTPRDIIERTNRLAQSCRALESRSRVYGALARILESAARKMNRAVSKHAKGSQ